MKHRLKIIGVLIFLFGLVLVGTYSRPNCTGISCQVAFPVLELSSFRIKNGDSVNAYVIAFWGDCNGETYEVASDNGPVQFHQDGSIYIASRMGHFETFYVPGCRGNLTVYTVSTYFSNITPPNLTYERAGGYFVFLNDYFLPLKEFHIEVSGPIGFKVTNWLNIFPAEDFRTYEMTYTNGTLQALDVIYRKQAEGIFVRNGTRIREMTVYDDPAAYKEFKHCTEHYEEIVKACQESGSPEYQLPAGVGLMLAGIALFAYGMKF